MRHSKLLPTLAVAFLAACGGGEPAETPDTDADVPAGEPAEPAAPAVEMPSGPMEMPEWYSVDHDARTVNMTLTSGSSNRNNYWNYEGYINGEIAINVPQGYEVTITLVNEDPNMPHSAVIMDRTSGFAQNPPAADPVFEGAATPNPTSMIDATMPGETDSITFTASETGTYGLVCTIPGHAALGMWLYFNVLPSDAEVGVQGL